VAQAGVACNETALVAAINSANAAGGGSIALTAGCVYHLTASSAVGTHGLDGLPIITTVISLTGSNYTITRSSLLPFRIAEVASTGSLTLTSVTLNNGLALGDGGGILNFGAVTLTGSGLTNNIASGTGGGLSNEDVAAPGAGPAATFTSSVVSGNTATGEGAGIYNGLRGTLTTTSTPVKSNTSLLAQGGGIAAIYSTATTLTSSPVSANDATLGGGAIYRLGGAMTITTSPTTGNTPNNCASSAPAVTGCAA
jgi:hypothetical protein